jgi:hypothetical protein
MHSTVVPITTNTQRGSRTNRGYSRRDLIAHWDTPCPTTHPFVPGEVSHPLSPQINQYSLIHTRSLNRIRVLVTSINTLTIVISFRACACSRLGLPPPVTAHHASSGVCPCVQGAPPPIPESIPVVPPHIPESLPVSPHRFPHRRMPHAQPCPASMRRERMVDPVYPPSTPAHHSCCHDAQ